MSAEPLEARPRFALLGRAPAIVLDADGLRHPRSQRGRELLFTPYGEITHLTLSARALWIATRHSVYLFPRRAFAEHHAPEHLVRGLLERVATRPGGAEQLARMAAIEELARSPHPRRATSVLALACLVVYALQAFVGPEVIEAGYYSPALVRDGDVWRLLTPILLHAFPLHFFFNLLGLIGVGSLVERPLGTQRTLCVMGAAAAGSALASDLAGYSMMVGASGVVFGLAGALFWLELRCAQEFPASWRLPRRLLAFAGVALVLEFAGGFAIPVIAGAAHLGGFVAGMLGAAAVTRGGCRATPRWTRPAAATVAAALALAVGAAGFDLVRGDFTARHAARLARLPDVSATELNNRAWLIATDPDATRAQVEAALALAERAVEETDRADATVLDTLAEVQFALGRNDEAIATIDEAIAREPDESYYREQRRRFTGERAADDRPDPPSADGPPGSPEPPAPPIPSDEPRLTA